MSQLHKRGNFHLILGLWSLKTEKWHTTYSPVGYAFATCTVISVFYLRVTKNFYRSQAHWHDSDSQRTGTMTFKWSAAIFGRNWSFLRHMQARPGISCLSSAKWNASTKRCAHLRSGKTLRCSQKSSTRPHPEPVGTCPQSHTSS